MKVISLLNKTLLYLSSFLCFILLFSTVIFAQEDIRFRRISPIGGFTDKAVIKIEQDHFGYIWIATNSRLFKYDSYTFQKYSFSENADSPLSHNEFGDMLVDKENNLWIGTEHGLFLYSYHVDSFELISITPENEPNDVTDIAMGIDNSILVAFSNSVYKYNLVTKTATLLPTPYGDVQHVFESSSGDLYLSFRYSGIGKLSASGNYQQIIPPKPEGILVSFFTDQLIYVAYEGIGLYTYTLNGELIETMTAENGKISHNKVNSIYEDSYGRLWVGTYKGLDIKKPNGEISHHKHVDGKDYSLASNSVYYVFEDLQDNFWVGTWSGGLSYLNKFDNGFEHLKHEPGLNSITDNYVSCFIEDENQNLFIGTERGGLNKFKPSKQEYEYIRLNKNSETPSNIKSFLYTKNGNLLVGTFMDGFYSIDKKGNISTIVTSLTEKTGDRVYALALSKDGIWVGDFKLGLYNLNLQTNEILEHYVISEDSLGLTSSQITCLLTDDEELWIGTTNGLNLKQAGKNYFKKFLFNSKDPTSISSNQIVSIVKDIQGNIWIGTRSGGINKFIHNEGRFIHYGRNDGLAGDDANGVICDDKGFIWISGENGISRLDPRDGSIMNYNITDGLQGNQFNRNAVFKASDGKLYFGGTNGYTIIDPSNIRLNPFEPKPIISQLRINNVVITPLSVNSPLSKSISETSEIELMHDQASISLTFISNNYLNPTKNEFTFRLLGFENVWQTTNMNQVTYNNLKPGSYTFELKASNNDGLWSENPLTLKIIIKPPWWKTTVAYILYILVFIGTLLVVRIMIISRERMKSDFKLEKLKRDNDEKTNALKLQFFTNSSHEFKTPLTLILSPLQRIIGSSNIDNETKNDLMLVEKNALRLQKLVNQFIEIRKIDKAKLNLYISETEFVSFVEDIFSCFKELAVNRHIDFDLDQQIEPTQVFIDVEKIDKAIFNIVSNAFKYTPDEGQVKITLKKTDPVFPEDWKQFTLGEPLLTASIKVVISDTGKGIREDDLSKIFERFFILEKTDHHTGSGIGLSLTREYAMLHHCRITVASKLGAGSIFVFEIPIKDENLIQQNHVQLIDNVVLPSCHRVDDMVDNEIAITKTTAPSNKNNKNAPLILVVEDNKELREYLIKILSTNFRVLSAVDGQEGLLMITKFYPDIVVSDVMMPNMNGMELCKQIKSNLMTSHIPVILLTALAETEDRIKGIETGADAYISKPFDILLLITQINNLVEVRKRLRISIGDSNEPKSRKEVLSTLDAALLKKAKKYIEDNITNPDISTTDLANVFAMSRTNLHRKLKSLSGQSATQFIKTIRLNYAMELIDKGNDSMEDVCYASGFNSTSYFSKCFKELFKMSPSEYKNSRFLKK
ncbi:hybrid sensor histidine kinase/response regulator transcription factor [Mariniphaga sediminis]|uniref:hybrid sensor histidine kinase/response regulator transcription factor n=1 Tax=Mariniphaga sediminis TaxID=1628158 RepID=UPI00356207BC